MLNMKYCRTENVISALREWEGDPGTDEHLHHELYELCSRIAANAGLVPDMTMDANDEGECSKHPCAPHGFNRNASHSEGRYVCDCEGWSPDRSCAGPELLEALKLARAELAGLPRSLGYDFTHLPKIDDVIARYSGRDG